MVHRGSPGVVRICSDRICLAVLGDDQSDIDPTDRPRYGGTAASRAAVTAFLRLQSTGQVLGAQLENS